MLADVLTSAASWLGERSLLTYVVPEELMAELRVGQLVAVPYGERLVEGIVWTTSQDEWVELEQGEELRPIHTILDTEPALLGHQMALAQWVADYYVTPLAYVAQMMLPPGLMQRSRAVLRLAANDEQAIDAAMQGGSLQLRALLGLLLTEGTIDVERLKELLGPKRAKAILKEARENELFMQDSQLDAPKAKARVKRVVRLVSRGDALQEWCKRTEEIAQRNALPVPVPVIPDHIMQPKSTGRKGRKAVENPWAIPEAVSATATLTLSRTDKESLRAQHQLAAVDLLLHNTDPNAHWSPNALCKASGMTKAQFDQLLREHILEVVEAELRRDPLMGRTVLPSQPLSLTPDQQHALNCIVGDEYDLRPILLHGVTGSGKTEVYLQSLAAIIAQGKQGIILVPEIALTTQAVLRVAGRFPDRVAIIHSELSTGERYDEWRRIRSGEVDVVIGSRSALFAPLPNLGIIILDEEHEPAYKQSERRPTYHAREVALMLGNILNIPVVLGSATPLLIHSISPSRSTIAWLNYLAVSMLPCLRLR
ncbi:DEAD/DEAH box helicase [Dictyobacter kobayashii]|uniref:DNA 3'-5' helicase n=1 Tax=Dictyobacter kobayashii TaxID=2014872 RepID=A0A402AH23_9CHLR|nr:DEAD/DEAH box helicase [Dictyobacter kobayashii]GCE18354.1 hypothetical protein KDK_21540 [Dictyobacter kobayashii]